MHKVTENVTKGFYKLIVKTKDIVREYEARVRGTNDHFDTKKESLLAEYRAQLAENERSRQAALRPLMDVIAEQEKIIAVYDAAASQLEK